MAMMMMKKIINGLSADAAMSRRGLEEDTAATTNACHCPLRERIDINEVVSFDDMMMTILRNTTMQYIHHYAIIHIICKLLTTVIECIVE